MTKLKQPEFVPISIEEAKKLGWSELDVIIVSGDAYVDHPSFGTALIGRYLIEAGFRVGIIPQPDWRKKESFMVLGKPRICFAVSSGNIDSMLKNYTAARRLRKEDEYSENAQAGRCPPNAVVIYSNQVRSAYPGVKVVIGGLEASMRRVVHYDYWLDKIRPSILLDSKADILVYGMAEKAVVDVIERISKDNNLCEIRSSARLAGAKESRQIDVSKYRELPSYEEILSNRDKLLEAFLIVEEELNPYNARSLLQRHGNRFLIIEPPQFPLTMKELDDIYSLPFAYAPHPSYKGKVPAFEMIKNSITAVRGCPGGCSFCSLGLHQGKFIQSRSIDSIICEIRNLASKKHFRGTISDIGGPTANSYGCGQTLDEICKSCRKPSCLFPNICRRLQIDQKEFIELLRKASRCEGVKHVFIGSGIRLDLALRQKDLTKMIIRNHVSGHLKIAPEHLDDEVLKIMRKNKSQDFFHFFDFFYEESKKVGKEQYLVPYFIANFPGSGEREFRKVEDFLRKSHWRLQQVQDFIPLPMTLASAIYYCEKLPDGRKIHVKKGLAERRKEIKKLKGAE